MVDKEFIVELRGKSYPMYAGVLSAATKAGLKSLATRVIQIPAPENGQLAVVMARAEFEDGRVFEDVGDCSPQSTSPQLAAASLRLASTRAKGRVLRDGINVGQTIFEELPDLDSLPDEESGRRGGEVSPRPASRAQGSSAPHPAAADGEALVCAACPRAITRGQRDISLRNYGSPLCPACQKTAVKAA